MTKQTEKNVCFFVSGYVILWEINKRKEGKYCDEGNH